MSRLTPPIAALALVASVAIGLSAAPALAYVKARDARATRRYLEARIVLFHADGVEQPRVFKALAALAAKVQRECPRVLAGEPPPVQGEEPSQSRREFSDELLTVVFGVAERIAHRADVRFERVVRRLRWSKPQLTELLHSLAAERAVLSGIATPDICADARFWVASGYTAVSPRTKRYLHRVGVASAIGQIPSEPHEPTDMVFSPEAIIAYRLKPYENRADRRLATEAFPNPATEFTGKPVKALIRLLDAQNRVYIALGVPPAPTKAHT